MSDQNRHDDAIPTPDHDAEREETSGDGEVCGYPVDRTVPDWPDPADDEDAATDDDGASPAPGGVA